MKPPLFITWKHATMVYLALPIDQSFHIMDETGNNYGTWYIVEDFRKRQREGGDWSPLGKVSRVQPIL